MLWLIVGIILLAILVWKKLSSPPRNEARPV